ncbi:hypothetical protein [Haloglomus irregulare]|uniref:hypothetical protein n=1 Tax=Haloglomus irregulare TaxID=2234134 RepID=UPI00192DBF75|nr:hypothetical protein [Haloglomus irregulare]
MFGFPRASGRSTANSKASTATSSSPSTPTSTGWRSLATTPLAPTSGRDGYQHLVQDVEAGHYDAVVV